MKSRSVSITGVTGFLGRHLAEAFQRAGWRVRAIVRPRSRKPVPDGIETVEAALEAASLARALGGSSLVVHSAALIRAGSEAELERVNVGGTRAVVEAANAVEAGVIFISSQAAIGPGSRARPSREDDSPQPLTAYGRSKLAAEAVVRSASRTPWTIVRPSAVYGPRDRGFLPLFRLAARGIFLQVADPPTPFTFVEVEDVVRAVLLVSEDERAVGETFFLGHEEPQTADELLRCLAAAFGHAHRPWQMPSVLVRAAGIAGEIGWKLGIKPVVDADRVSELRAGGFVCTSWRIRDRLGFSAATPLPEGVARTARWYRDRGWV